MEVGSGGKGRGVGGKREYIHPIGDVRNLEK